MTHDRSTFLQPPFLAGMLVLVFCMALVACGEPPRMPLRVGVNPWLGYEPLVLARELKLLDPEVIRVVELESTGESMRQLRNGRLQAAGLTLAEAIELAGLGLDIKVISLLSLSRGADAVVARKEIKTPAALAGARIGIENSALADVMLQRLLAAGNLRLIDVNVVRLSILRHEAALTQGQVDAVITFDPVLSRLATAGYNVLLDSARMPGDVVDVLVIRTDALLAHPDQARALLQAFERGRRALLAQPVNAAQMLASGADLTSVEYLEAVERVRFFSLDDSVRTIDAMPDVPALALQQLADDLRASHRVMNQPDWRLLFDNNAAKRALVDEGTR
jgi:NitT/TauT family transport system substrate-binding protein